MPPREEKAWVHWKKDENSKSIKDRKRSSRGFGPSKGCATAKVWSHGGQTRIKTVATNINGCNTYSFVALREKIYESQIKKNPGEENSIRFQRKKVRRDEKKELLPLKVVAKKTGRPGS